MQNNTQHDQSELKQYNQVLRFIKAQFLVTFLVSVVLLIIDTTWAYSALVGGLIAALANAWFVLKVFRTKARKKNQPKFVSIKPMDTESIAVIVDRGEFAKVEQSADQVAEQQQTAETVLATFYVAEIYKFLFTGAMFIIAFVLIKPISVIALLLTYFLVHMTPAVVNVTCNDINDSSIRDKEK